jgi:hypothetical protein
MPNTRISDLTAAASVAGTDVYPSVQTAGVGPVKTSLTQITAFALANAPAGAVATPSIAPTGDTNTGFWFPAADTIAASTGGSERMRITSAGNVGIGTTSPGATLDVFGNIYVSNTTTSGAAALVGRAAGSNTWIVGPDNSINGGTDQGLSLYSYGATNVRFYTNASERMRITSAGNVLIGTTDATLGNTNGIVLGSNVESAWTTSTSGAVPIRIYNKGASGTRYIMEFRNASSAVGAITHDGTNTTYATSSDVSLKDNITDAASALASVLSMKIRQWDWKIDGSHTNYGVVAQEAIENAPEMVVKGDLWSVDYGRLTPRIVKAIQELAAEVAALKAKNA